MYGIGCFMFMNMGEKVVKFDYGLLIILVWGINGKVEYVFEGSIFVVGFVIQWFCDGLRMFKNVVEIENYVMCVEFIDGVYIVLVFVGFGMLYWDSDVWGVMFGLICGIKKEYFICVMFELLVY